MVSACLLGENCKYSSGNNYRGSVAALAASHELIPVCPEVLGGLPVPRKPAEIKDGVVTCEDGSVVDGEYRLGARKCLETALREQPGLVVLQPRSPSCGVHTRYDGSFSGTLTEGPGVTAELLIKNGFRVIDADDLEAGDLFKDAEAQKVDTP